MMRIYGQLYDEEGNYTWQVVTTDANGFNDEVYIVALIQDLLLNLGESPFYGKDGIPYQQTMVTQVWPDYYVAKVQRKYAQYFAALNIIKVNSPAPTYNITILTHRGATITRAIPT